MHKRQFCTFRIADRLFGVDILDVKEVNPEISFTPVYHAPKEVLGYVNIRGRIHLILDLRLLLGFESRHLDETSRIVLFKPHAGESFGVLVDRIGDVADVDETQIEDRRKNDQGHPEGHERRISDLGIGVCRLKDELMVILNSKLFLKHIQK